MRGMCERVGFRHQRAVCPTALRVCRKFEICSRSVEKFDGTESDLNDATMRL